MKWVEFCPPKDVFKSESPVIVNVNLLGNRVFSGQIKMKSNYWVRVGLKPMIYRKRDIWVYTQKTQGKTYVKMEA